MPLQDLFLDTKKIPPPYLYLYLIAWILKITFHQMLGTLTIEMKNKSILDLNWFFFYLYNKNLNYDNKDKT